MNLADLALRNTAGARPEAAALVGQAASTDTDTVAGRNGLAVMQDAASAASDAVATRSFFIGRSAGLGVKKAIQSSIDLDADVGGVCHRVEADEGAVGVCRPGRPIGEGGTAPVHGLAALGLRVSVGARRCVSPCLADRTARSDGCRLRAQESTDRERGA